MFGKPGEIAPESFFHLSYISFLFSSLFHSLSHSLIPFSSSCPQPYMQPVRVVDAQPKSQIPGFPGTMHILIGAVCHYPDSFLIEMGNQLLQLFGSPAPGGLSQYKFQVNVLLYWPSSRDENSILVWGSPQHNELFPGPLQEWDWCRWSRYGSPHQRHAGE